MAKARRANEVSGDLLRSSDGIVLVVGLLGLMISFDKVETVFQQNKQPSHDLTATNPILGNGWLGKIALASETKLQSFPHNWSAIQGEAPRHSHRGYHNLRVRMVNQQVRGLVLRESGDVAGAADEVAFADFFAARSASSNDGSRRSVCVGKLAPRHHCGQRRHDGPTEGSSGSRDGSSRSDGHWKVRHCNAVRVVEVQK